MPAEYPLPSADPATLGFAATPLQHLDRLIRQHIEEGRYPGAQIALARHGKLALFRSYGSGKTEPRNLPAADDTLFLLFSQTKVLTSCAVWTLIEEGKLSFMDPRGSLRLLAGLDSGHSAAIPPARRAPDPGNDHRSGNWPGLSRRHPRAGVGASRARQRHFCRRAAE